MHILLALSIMGAIAGCIYLFNGIFGDGDPMTGVVILLIDILFGFVIGCGLIPIQKLPTRYVDPESQNVDVKYVMAAYDNKYFGTGQARFIEKAKDGILKIKIIDSCNSYGYILETQSSLEIFSKEEWEKIDYNEQ